MQHKTLQLELRFVAYLVCKKLASRRRQKSGNLSGEYFLPGGERTEELEKTYQLSQPGPQPPRHFGQIHLRPSDISSCSFSPFLFRRHGAQY
jgi:hypothetical protein